MKKSGILLAVLLFTGCKKQPVYAPLDGGSKQEKPIDISRERSKNRNEQERKFIRNWIAGQKKVFYPMPSNYWSDIDFSIRQNNTEDLPVSYQYDQYDFNNVRIYDMPVVRNHIYLRKTEELKAVEDAVRHMHPNEEATLLVPSVLAYGTYGDGKTIGNDLPLIIKLKILEEK